MDSNYEKCKKQIMEKIMKEYESGKLKRAKSRKQAIAIGLSMSERQCKSKIGKKDISNIENKAENVENAKLSVAFVKDCIILINYYQKNKKYKKSKDLKDKLLKRVLKETVKTNKVNKIMLDSVIDIL